MFALPGHTQPVGPGQGLKSGQGIKFTEYYPTRQTQLKSVLECARAQPQPDGRILGTVIKYQTFTEAGAGEMTVQAPQCYYDREQRTISSSGPLHVQAAEGNFSIEGEGFLFQQTNSTLWVSNRVHTILHPELLSRSAAATNTNAAVRKANAAAEETSGMDIFSDQFTYSEESGRGVYEGNVHITGTNLTSTEGKLTIVLTAPERQLKTHTAEQLGAPERKLKTLTAEQNVVVDYVTASHERVQAAGGRAFYSADTDLVQMTGQPTWRVGQRDGSGDELIFDRTNNIFRANGHASLKMPAQGLGSSGLLSRTNTAARTPTTLTNQSVAILCDNYELRTNLAVFREQVSVCERLGDQLQGQMTCSLLTLTFSGTNELQKMVAEHRVLIEQEDRKFTAEKAEYTGTNTVLELTGDPRWQAGPRQGNGDQIRLNLAHDEMLVHGNAFMRLPAAELGQSAASAMGKPKRGESRARTNEFAEVFCEEYFLTADSALFRGHVRIKHPQMNWVCDEITMLMPPTLGKAGRIIIAEPDVVFDFTNDQGQTFHGTGNKVVYTHRTTATLTNDLVELTGSPAVLESTNLVGRNNIINLDLASYKLTAPGKYKLWGSAPAVATTSLQPSKTRSKKQAKDPL
jgi:lipopolysaccharide export system protein LptA